jgi:hypothetical protein
MNYWCGAFKTDQKRPVFVEPGVGKSVGKELRKLGFLGPHLILSEHFKRAACPAIWGGQLGQAQQFNAQTTLRA